MPDIDLDWLRGATLTQEAHEQLARTSRKLVLEKQAKAGAGVLGTVGDLGLGVAQGFTALGGMVGSGLGLATGVMDQRNELTNTFGAASDWLASKESDALKARRELAGQAIDEADGFWGTVFEGSKQYLTNPRLFSAEVTKQVALMGAPLMLGRAATGAAAARGLVGESAGRVGMHTAIAAGAIEQGADVASEAYQDAIKAGASGEEALSAARQTFLMATATSAASQYIIPGGSTIERVVAGRGLAAGLNKGAQGLRDRATRAALGGIGESTQEFTEETTGQMAANIARANIGQEVDLLEGVAEVGGPAAALGLGMGGVTGALERGRPGGLQFDASGLTLDEDDGIDVPPPPPPRAPPPPAAAPEPVAVAAEPVGVEEAPVPAPVVEDVDAPVAAPAVAEPAPPAVAEPAPAAVAEEPGVPAPPAPIEAAPVEVQPAGEVADAEVQPEAQPEVQPEEVPAPPVSEDTQAWVESLEGATEENSPVLTPEQRSRARTGGVGLVERALRASVVANSATQATMNAAAQLLDRVRTELEATPKLGAAEATTGVVAQAVLSEQLTPDLMAVLTHTMRQLGVLPPATSATVQAPAQPESKPAPAEAAQPEEQPVHQPTSALGAMVEQLTPSAAQPEPQPAAPAPALTISAFETARKNFKGELTKEARALATGVRQRVTAAKKAEPGTEHDVLTKAVAELNAVEDVGQADARAAAQLLNDWAGGNTDDAGAAGAQEQPVDDGKGRDARAVAAAAGVEPPLQPAGAPEPGVGDTGAPARTRVEGAGDGRDSAGGQGGAALTQPEAKPKAKPKTAPRKKEESVAKQYERALAGAIKRAEGAGDTRRAKQLREQVRVLERDMRATAMNFGASATGTRPAEIENKVRYLLGDAAKRLPPLVFSVRAEPVAHNGSLADTLQTDGLNAGLTRMSTNSPSSRNRAIAGILASLGLQTRVVIGPVPGATVAQRRAAGPNDIVIDGQRVGMYDPVTDTVTLDERALDEQLVLHETTHAATEASIHAVETGGDTTPEQRAGVAALTDVFKSMQQWLATRGRANVYGLTTLSEFVAEAWSNPDFQQELKNAKPGGGTFTLWERLVRAVRKLLGLHDGNPSALDVVDEAIMAVLSSEIGTATQPRFMYLGGGAKTMNLQRYRQAQVLKAAGSTDEEIRQQTGWFQGVDGQWRFEIDDSQMKFLAPFEGWDMLSAPGEYYTWALGDVLHHPELFAAYPELEDIVVSRMQAGGPRGRRNRRTNEIQLAEDQTAHQALRTLVHELQHVVQGVEGFAAGGMPTVERLFRPGVAAIVRARVTDDLAAIDAGTFQAKPGYEQKLRDALEALAFIEANVDRYAQLEQLLETAGTDRHIYSLDASITEMADLRSRVPPFVQSIAYMLEAGEVEARDTAARLKYDAADRAMVEPLSSESITPEQQILTSQDGTAMSAEPLYSIRALPVGSLGDIAQSEIVEELKRVGKSGWTAAKDSLGRLTLSLPSLETLARMFKDVPALQNLVDVLARRDSHGTAVEILADTTVRRLETAKERPAIEALLRRANEVGLDPTVELRDQQAAFDALANRVAKEQGVTEEDAQSEARDQWREISRMYAALGDDRAIFESIREQLDRQRDHIERGLVRFVTLTVSDPVQRKAMVEEIRKEFERFPRGYFPLSRFGGYGVAAYGKQGELLGFYMEESKARQDEAAAKLAQDHPGAKVQRFKQAQLDQLVGGIKDSTLMNSMQAMLAGSVADPTLRGELQAQMQKLFVATLPQLHAKQKFLPRRFVRGASSDVPRTFGAYIKSSNNYVAQLLHNPMMTAAMQDMADLTSGKPSRRKAFVVSIVRNDGARPTLRVFDNLHDATQLVGSTFDSGHLQDYRLQIVSHPQPTQAQLKGQSVQQVRDIMLRSQVEQVMSILPDRSTAAYAGMVDHILDSVNDSLSRVLPEDTTRLGDVEAEVRRRVIALTQNSAAKIVQFAGNLTYLYYLGASPSFLIQQVTQNPLVTMPFVAGTFGARATARAFRTAGARALRGMTGPFKAGWKTGTFNLDLIEGLSKDEHKLLAWLQELNVLDPTQTYDLGRVVAAAGPASDVWQKVMRYGTLTGHYSEMANRVVAALAAYDLAMSRANQPRFDSEEKRREYVRHVISRTHLNYAAYNKAGVATMNTAFRLAFQFRTYSFGMTEHVLTMFNDAIRGESAEVKREARRALFYSFGTGFLAAGLRGLPFYSAYVLAAALLGVDDPEDELKTFAGQMLGSKEAAEALLRGPGYLAGGDMSLRIGMGSILPFDNVFDSTAYSNALHAAAFNLIGGPFGSILEGAVRTAPELYGKGEVQKAAEMLMPKALRDLSAAQRWIQDGVTMRNGDMLMAADSVDLGMLLWKAAGVNPARLSEVYDDRSKIMGLMNKVADARGRYLLRYAVAMRSGNLAEAGRVREEAARDKSVQFQAKDWIQAVRRQQARDRVLARTGGIAASKAQERFLRELYAEAEDGNAD